MKKTKKLIALTSSFVLCSSFFTSFNDNALAYCFDRNSDEYHNFFKGYHELVNTYGFFGTPTEGKTRRIYASDDAEGLCSYIIEELDYNRFSFTIPKVGSRDDWDEIVQQVVVAFDSSYEVTSKIYNESNIVEYTVYDKNLNTETLRNARAICDELKKQGVVSSFTYSGDVSNSIAYYSYITAYGYEFHRDYENLTLTLDEFEESIKKYVEENNLDCSVAKYSGTEADKFEPLSDNVIYVEPNSDVSFEEKLKIASQIKKDLGYGFFSISPTSADTTAFSTEIDLFNATYGDLNDDSKLTPVDASLLLSYYSESQIGTETEADMTYELLGDVNNDGKVTPVDASLVLRQYAENQTK